MPETHLEFSLPLRTCPDSQSHVLILPSAAQQLRLVRSCASFCPCAHLADSSRTSPEVREATERSAAARARSFSASTFSGPGLLLPARLSGVSIHRRLALGGHGGFGAGIQRRGVRRCRLDIDRATRPAEIVGPSPRRCDSLPRAQPNGRPPTFAGSS